MFEIEDGRETPKKPIIENLASILKIHYTCKKNRNMFNLEITEKQLCNTKCDAMFVPFLFDFKIIIKSANYWIK